MHPAHARLPASAHNPRRLSSPIIEYDIAQAYNRRTGSAFPLTKIADSPRHQTWSCRCFAGRGRPGSNHANWRRPAPRLLGGAVLWIVRGVLTGSMARAYRYITGPVGTATAVPMIAGKPYSPSVKEITQPASTIIGSVASTATSVRPSGIRKTPRNKGSVLRS